MDNKPFDACARLLPLTTSRRRIARFGTGALAAAVLVRLGLTSPEVLAAKSGKCKKPCGECERCDKGKCQKKKNGKKRCKRGTCKPRADFTNCSFGFCENGDCSPT